MLIVRGTKKLRDRVKGPAASDDDVATTELGEWFANALFWKPQVAMLVSTRTFLPVFMPLAPAATLLDRAPDAIAEVLRFHDVPEAFIADELAAMADARIAPTNDRSVLSVMNDLAYHGRRRFEHGLDDLVELSAEVAGVPLGVLRDRTGFPDRELAALVGRDTIEPDRPLAKVIPIRPGIVVPDQAPTTRTAPPNRGTIYQLKVTLHDTKPPIWRRVLVHGSSTLDELHDVIQAAFGWWDSHLHEFEIGRKCYGVPDPDDDWGPPTIDERRVRLDAVADEGTRFSYNYDFGDDWHHKVLVEKVLPADPTVTVPDCTDGRRACPPEDCGGPWGYRSLLEILADPDHPEHKAKRDWLGRPFDPAKFEAGDFAEALETQRTVQFDDGF